MFPRLFELKSCTNQAGGCNVNRNGVCMNGFFSALGPTNMEICHAHARGENCTAFCSQTLGPDPRGATRVVVCGGERSDGWTSAVFVAVGAWVDGARQPEGCAQAG